MGQTELSQEQQDAWRVYKQGSEKFSEITPSLSANEIIQGYQQGCEVLRRNLTGYMYNHFDPAYVSLMVKTIEDDEAEGLYFFVNALSKHLDRKSLIPIILQALKGKSYRTRRAALEVVQNFKIVEAIAATEKMYLDLNEGVADLARKVGESLKKEDK
jgi:hypothetical protein